MLVDRIRVTGGVERVVVAGGGAPEVDFTPVEIRLATSVRVTFALG
jgi:hypothetical protein